MFLKNIPLPQKIDCKNLENNKAEIIIEPCYPGYGVTLGNSLRRVLLSSLEGTAINAIKVNNVSHEFSTIPYVKEDLVEIVLNLKKLKIRSHSDEPIKLELRVKGEKKVTAGDITKNSEVEIISKDLLIATLTDKKAIFDIDLTVSKGRGYTTVESREKEKLEIGNIAIDSLYSPVINVGFEIENVRVGQKTDYEKIILSLETDGSITPKEALNQSTKILVDHFQQILNPVQEEKEEQLKMEEEKTIIPEKKDLSLSKDDKKSDEIEIKPVDSESTEPVKKKRGRPKKIVTEK